MAYIDTPQTPRLSELVDMTDRKEVIDNIAKIFSYSFPNHDFSDVRRVFNYVADLYDGKNPDYQSCDIKYHDFKHTTDVALATARMIDGAILAGFGFTPDMVKVTLIEALFHDVGYLKEKGDDGSGAKYTKTHVLRSADFAYDYFDKHNKKGTSQTARDMIFCTDISKKPQKDISFKSESTKTLGMILGSADLVAQMADRIYLEKLPHLYDEFVKGGLPFYSDEFDLLVKTPGFYKVQKTRLDDDLNSMYSFASLHFQKRFGIGTDLYSEAIDKNLAYLEKVIAAGKEGYDKLLHRTL